MTDPTLDEAIAIGRRRRLRRRRPALRRPLTIIGLVIAGAWLVLIVFGDLIAPADPLAQDFPRFESPSAEHWFGTDGLGRDVLSRVILGARVTIPLAVLLVFLAMTIGATAGAVAGYFAGAVDGTIMRLSDLVFAFPPIILAMAVVASLGPGPAQRRPRRRHRRLAVVRPGRAQPRAHVPRARVRRRVAVARGDPTGGRSSST